MEKLLILGAGGYGCTVAEAADGFESTAFLDDARTGAHILGPCALYTSLRGEYRWAYPAFGDNALRALWLERLRAAGFALPVLVHARAWVSPSAVLEPGAVVLAQAAVGARAHIGAGCIVNMGALVDHDCVLGACVHLAPGAVVKACCTVGAGQKIESGAVVERGTALSAQGGAYV